jgi:hypothetical protein
MSWLKRGTSVCLLLSQISYCTCRYDLRLGSDGQALKLCLCLICWRQIYRGFSIIGVID